MDTSGSFALAYGSLWIWGFSNDCTLVYHCTIVVTVVTFETAKRKPQVFDGYNGRQNGGEHE